MKLLEITEIICMLFPVSPNGNNIATAVLTLIESSHLIQISPFLLVLIFSLCKGVRVCVLSFMQFRHLCMFVYPHHGRDTEPHISTPQGSSY